MSKLSVKKVSKPEDRSLPVFGEIEALFEKVRQRAYERFTVRGVGGQALDDWLDAEREICWPASELIEEDDEFEIKVALAGFKPGEIGITATPRELIIKAEHDYDEIEDDDIVHFSEFRRSATYRRIPLPAEIDVTDIEVEFENGLLSIEAPKAGKARPKKKTRAGKKNRRGKATKVKGSKAP